MVFIGNQKRPQKNPVVIKKLDARIEDMTGLSTISAERLQIVNYGIGGQYEPHFDFYNQKYKMKRGNRIATILFYVFS